MKQSEKIKRLELIYENACALSQAGDPLLEGLMPSVLARIHTLLSLEDPENPSWDEDIVIYE